MELIYRPELKSDRENHPIRFVRPKNNLETAAQSHPELMLQGTWIEPGRNNISLEEWDYITENPLGKQYFAKGIFQLIESEADKETGTLEDYSDANALTLVEHTYDVEVLELELNRERRGEIVAAIRKRINWLEQEFKRRSQTSMVEAVY